MKTLETTTEQQRADYYYTKGTCGLFAGVLGRGTTPEQAQADYTRRLDMQAKSEGFTDYVLKHG